MAAQVFEDTDLAYELQLTEALAASCLESVHEDIDEQIAWELVLQEVKDDAEREAETKTVEKRDQNLAMELALQDLNVQDPSASAPAAAHMRDLFWNGQPVTCKICLDAKPPSTFLVLLSCQHMFCRECISNYVEAQVKSAQVPVVCPHEGCSQFLGTGDYEELIISPLVLEALTKLEVEASIPELERFYCPFSDCSALMTKPEIGDEGTDAEGLRSRTLRMLGVSWFDGSRAAPFKGSVECFSCHRLFCAECQVPWHTGYTCRQFQKLSVDDIRRAAENEEAFRALVKSNRWMRCSNCDSVVERSQGCNHMKCRCRYEFCYRCGRDWKICYYSPCIVES